MPDCIDCQWLDGSICRAFPSSWPDVPVNHIRTCVIAICKEYCNLIKAGMRVLEIGCGTWSPIYEYCQQVGAQWDGIDISQYYYGQPTIATRIESVEQLSFPDKTFDLVIGNQTLEHWNEFGCRPESGLWQCFRVCKIGGLVLMNVPIHFHGSRIFVEGDFNAIFKLFKPFSFNTVLTSWRRNSYPLKPINLLNGYNDKRKRNSYVLDIRAVRALEMPEAKQGYFIRWRPFRELFDHKFDYLFWKFKSQLLQEFKKVKFLR